MFLESSTEDGVFAVAIVSAVSAICTLLTPVVFIPWRTKIRTQKHLILVMNVYMFFYALSCLYLSENKPNINCRIQGSFIQVISSLIFVLCRCQMIPL